MRFVLALVVALFCACLQAGDRQRCRLLSVRAQSCTVVNPAPALLPVYAPIQPVAASVPVSSCPGGVCPAPVPQSRGLFGFRR